MVYITYFMIGLVASVLGAIAGLGGGLIIKPVLDAFSSYDAVTISALSSLTVFAMSSMSLKNQISSGAKPPRALWATAFGALGGGLLGKALFTLFIAYFGAGDFMKGILSLLLVLMLLISMVLAQGKFAVPPSTFGENGAKMWLSYGLTGVLLGTVSTFLGIGGGPLNIALFVVVFAMDRKLAVTASIFIIFTSQFTNLAQLFLEGFFWNFDFKVALAIVPGGIAGGMIGSRIFIKMKPKHVMAVYYSVTTGTLILNLINAIRFFT